MKIWLVYSNMPYEGVDTETISVWDNFQDAEKAAEKLKTKVLDRVTVEIEEKILNKYYGYE